MSENIIKIKGKKYNLDNIKAGIQQKDIEKSNNKALISLFNALDKANQYGFKNKTLDAEETQDFIQHLLDIAENNRLSRAEAKEYFASLGLDDLKISDLSQFLDIIIEKSEEIKETTYNNERNSQLIEYNEGYYNEVLYDGRQVIKAKETEDESLKPSFTMNVPFTHMKDRTGNAVIMQSIQSDVVFDIESIISKNGIDTSNSKTIYLDDQQKIKDTVIYFDSQGNEILSVKYNGSDIKSIEYKQGNHWIQMNQMTEDDAKYYKNNVLKDHYMINDYLCNTSSYFSVSILDENKNGILSKTEYFKNTRVSESICNPNTGRVEKTNYDYISGKKTLLEVFDEKGRVVKKQYFDTNEQIESTEVIEYVYDSKVVLKVKKYDKDNNLISNEQKSINPQKVEYENIYDKILKEKIDIIKQQLEVHIEKYVREEDKIPIRELMLQKFDECLNSETFETEFFIDNAIREPLAALNYFLTILHKSEPNGTVDQINYQGRTGDCWLLGPTSAIAEVPDGGQEYIKSLFVRDEQGNLLDENGNATVALMGGESKYKINISDDFNFYELHSDLSLGDPDMRILELAFKKHLGRSLNGDTSYRAYEIYSGNKKVDVIRQDGKLYVPINGENIELCEKNADKLAEIPILIGNLEPGDFEVLSKLKHRTAMSSASYGGTGGHAFYIKDINKNSIQVKEPHNTRNIATYSIDGFIENYDGGDFAIFILPKK